MEISSKYNDPTERTACFLACMSNALNIKFIVTGGFAVELLTGSTYRTYDVDLIPLSLEDAMKLEGELKGLGERPSREWIIDALPKAIDVLPINETPYLEVETPCGSLYVEKPERLLVRYLSSWKYWESREDQHKAIALAYALEGLIDWQFVKALAEKEGVDDKLRELRRWLSRLKSSKGDG